MKNFFLSCRNMIKNGVPDKEEERHNFNSLMYSSNKANINESLNSHKKDKIK